VSHGRIDRGEDEVGTSGPPIVHIVGARPQFVKAAAVLAAAPRPERSVLVHTGQHYDASMSDVFFAELGIPRPHHHLGVGSGSHGAQTGAMLGAIEAVLQATPPGVVVVYGDTNSTVAGALAAAKLGWRIAHVEAGLRSYDRSMPEEVNRVVADHLSDALLCPTVRAVEQLAREGLTRGVVDLGDVMLDVARQQAVRARDITAVGRYLTEPAGPAPTPLDALPAGAARPGGYALATIHRAANTDDPARLRALLAALGRLPLPVLFPVHPRTRKAMQQAGIAPADAVRCVDPLGYLDFAALLGGAGLVLTDSGGVQKEAYFAGRRCITLRDRTEWPETLESGWNTLVGDDPAAIVAAAASAPPASSPRIEQFGDGAAAVRIAALVDQLA
jgi:UDP-N-acetylglucosamine 2-epimerase